MKKYLLVSLGILLALAVTVPAGAASPPTGVVFEVETSLLGDPSPFVASGPAVDVGLMCDTGIVVDATAQVTGFSPTGFNWQGIKHFTCNDDSGEFFVNVQARIDYRKGTTFYWNVLFGTGDYIKLHGAGTGVGLPSCGLGCVLDVYEGGLHIN